MNPKSISTYGLVAVAFASTLLIAGCATTPKGAKTVKASSKFRTTDDRTIDIGPRSESEGGWNFKNPHLDKCWLADGFDFNGYDTLYIAPTLSTATLKPDANATHEIAKENIVTEVNRYVRTRNLYPNIVRREQDIKPDARVLKMENTITQFSKGGGAARFFAGEFGAGQPEIRVVTKLMVGDKVVFSCEGRRSGASARGRMLGGSMSDEDVQVRDIRSLVLDMTDFMAAIAGKYQPLN
jgi:hypothetical protein